MKRTFRLIALFLLIAVFSGCAGANTPQSPTVSLAPPTPTATSAPTAIPIPPTPTEAPQQFDGERAYQDVLHQDSLGPRTPGSEAHRQIAEWMRAGLTEAGWQVELQETTYRDQPMRNVIAKRGTGTPWTILGAHYDSRFFADNDPLTANHQTPVPGANDGASGVAVLMELARVLPADLEGQVWLVFFDSEDQGRIPGWDWILGSRAFAESLQGTPDSVVIVDMIGDASQDIYYEGNSDAALREEIWGIAADLGYGDRFIPTVRHNMLDDHTPFLEKGIRAIDIIDFDYPYWHTVDDTPDKVSAESLESVGRTLQVWLAGKNR